ncbi:MAG: hypothetical protein CM1200mP6_08790 [Anaerolineaceae bacterium]|nr:MAG: hypothetical protein CM1200mP6_08790 [Anaerolineaceae bacterium]
MIRGINAFTLGAREVNPDVEVRVVWTNTWFGPPEEKEAADALLAAGADMIAQHQDTTEPKKQPLMLELFLLVMTPIWHICRRYSAYKSSLELGRKVYRDSRASHGRHI